MKICMTKIAISGGICALLAGAAGAASAQDYHADGAHHGPMHARRHIQRLKADYAHDVASGHYGAAQRAHLQARAIRQNVRAHRETAHRDMDHQDTHRDRDH